jgi:hypothetical protein
MRIDFRAWGRTELSRAGRVSLSRSECRGKGRIPFNSARLDGPFPNTQRTPNPPFGDWGRSARLGPSRRRRGSRRCGRRQAAARRQCSPAHRDERRLRPGAAGAPTRHQGSAPSAGLPSASCRASRPPRCRGSGSRRCMSRTGQAPRLRDKRLSHLFIVANIAEILRGGSPRQVIAIERKIRDRVVALVQEGESLSG